MDPLKYLAKAVILQAAKDAGLYGRVKVIPPRWNDAVAFFKNAAAGGAEKVWFDLAGLRPKLLYEEVASRWQCA
ncbi:MAG: hypothetical protein ACPLTR_12220 [Thermacetogeniaceae bacterium]